MTRQLFLGRDDTLDQLRAALHRQRLAVRHQQRVIRGSA